MSDLAYQLSDLLLPIKQAIDSAAARLKNIDGQVASSLQYITTLGDNERDLREQVGKLAEQVAAAKAESVAIVDRARREAGELRSQAIALVAAAKVEGDEIRAEVSNARDQELADRAQQVAELEKDIAAKVARLQNLNGACEAAQRKLEKIKAAARDFAGD